MEMSTNCFHSIHEDFHSTIFIAAHVINISIYKFSSQELLICCMEIHLVFLGLKE